MNSQEEFAQPTIYVGAKAPEGFKVMILVGASGVDLSAVTGVKFLVTNGLDRDVEWAATIDIKQPDKLVVHHTFDADGVETRKAGRYRLIPVLTLPSGVRRAPAFYLGVMA